MEVEEYKIIESPNLGSLAEKVNAALNEGWQPYAAPFGAVAGRCQAMVKFRRPTAAGTSPPRAADIALGATRSRSELWNGGWGGWARGAGDDREFGGGL